MAHFAPESVVQFKTESPAHFHRNTHYHLWRGSFMANTGLEEGEERQRRELLGLYQQICVKWAQLLSQDGLLEETIRIVERALSEDATFEPLVRILFTCHVQNGSPAQAGQILKRYEEELLKQEFLPEDADEILEGFWK